MTRRKTQTDISAQLKRNTHTLDRIAKQVETFRRTHPSVRAPPSVFRAIKKNDSASIKSFETTHLSLEEIQSSAQLIPASIRGKLNSEDLAAIARLIDEFETKLQSERDHANYMNLAWKAKTDQALMEHMTQRKKDEVKWEQILNDRTAQYAEQSARDSAHISDRNRQIVDVQHSYEAELDRIATENENKLQQLEKQHERMLSKLEKRANEDKDTYMHKIKLEIEQYESELEKCRQGNHELRIRCDKINAELQEKTREYSQSFSKREIEQLTATIQLLRKKLDSLESIMKDQEEFQKTNALTTEQMSKFDDCQYLSILPLTVIYRESS
jgi:DNA repair exonuclease SbcCD ATPase subunit